MKKTQIFQYSENITTDRRTLKIKYLGKFKTIEATVGKIKQKRDSKLKNGDVRIYSWERESLQGLCDSIKRKYLDCWQKRHGKFIERNNTKVP